MKRTILVGALALALTGTCSAELPTAEKYDDVDRLLVLMGLGQTVESIARNAAEQNAQALKVKLPNIVGPQADQVKQAIYDAYLKHRSEIDQTSKRVRETFAENFTQEELKQLIAFYSSPVGRKAHSLSAATISYRAKANEAVTKQVSEELTPVMQDLLGAQVGLAP
ncbi:DUF2059 domain-containing protein [Pseudomonas aeruginosa]